MGKPIEGKIPNNESVKRSKDRSVIENFSNEELFAFFFGDKKEKLLQRVFDICMDSEDKTSIPLLTDLMNRLFGKPTEKHDHTSGGEKIQQIFIGNLKGDGEDRE